MLVRVSSHVLVGGKTVSLQLRPRQRRVVASWDDGRHGIKAMPIAIASSVSLVETHVHT